MRLNEQESQLATAAVQLLEREIAEHLERHPEARGFDYRVSDDERRVLERHDRIADVVRKLSTAGDHELFDWEAQLVRESLARYRAALSNEEPPEPPIADENSQLIETDAQRSRQCERATTLLDRFRSS